MEEEVVGILPGPGFGGPLLLHRTPRLPPDPARLVLGFRFGGRRVPGDGRGRRRAEWQRLVFAVGEAEIPIILKGIRATDTQLGSSAFLRFILSSFHQPV